MVRGAGGRAARTVPWMWLVMARHNVTTGFMKPTPVWPTLAMQ